MSHDIDPAAAFAAVAAVLSRILDLDRDSLLPGSSVDELDIDSMDAAEIVVQVQRELDVDIDLRQVANDWSGLTLADLGDELVRCALPSAPASAPPPRPAG